jgi:hypothetical protein
VYENCWVFYVIPYNLLLIKNSDLPLITLMIFQLNEMHNCGKYHLLVLEEEKTAHKFLLEKINHFVSFYYSP